MYLALCDAAAPSPPPAPFPPDCSSCPPATSRRRCPRSPSAATRSAGGHLRRRGKALQTADLAKCLADKDIKSISVDPDDTVRFGVDPTSPTSGWTILMNGQPLTEDSDKTYRTDPGQRVLQPPVRRPGQLARWSPSRRATARSSASAAPACGPSSSRRTTDVPHVQRPSVATAVPPSGTRSPGRSPVPPNGTRWPQACAAERPGRDRRRGRPRRSPPPPPRPP